MFLLHLCNKKCIECTELSHLLTVISAIYNLFYHVEFLKLTVLRWTSFEHRNKLMCCSIKMWSKRPNSSLPLAIKVQTSSWSLSLSLSELLAFFKSKSWSLHIVLVSLITQTPTKHNYLFQMFLPLAFPCLRLPVI